MMAIRRDVLLALCAASCLVVGPGRLAIGADVSGLAGTWTWSWKDAEGMEHRHVLDIEGVDTKLAARERRDDLPPVRVNDLKLTDKRVRFSVVRGNSRADYSGVWADANTLNGTVTVTIEGQSTEHVWKATRSDKKKEEKEVK
jgi:hypothetical protein